MNQIPTGKYKAVLAIAYDAIGRPFESKYIDGLYIDTVDDRNLNYMETSKGLYDPYCGQFCQINRSGEDQWTWQNIRRDNNDNNNSNTCTESTPHLSGDQLSDRCIGAPRVSVYIASGENPSNGIEYFQVDWGDGLVTTSEPATPYQGINFSLHYKNIDNLSDGQYSIPFNIFNNPLPIDGGNLCKVYDCSPLLGSVPRIPDENQLAGSSLGALGCISNNICTRLICSSNIDLDSIIWDSNNDEIDVTYIIPKNASCPQGLDFEQALCLNTLTPFDETFSGEEFKITYTFQRV